jgi:hypothetical protein
MKKWRLSALLVLGLLLFTAIPSDAGGRHHGGGGHGHRFHGGGSRFFVGIGPVWPAPWWYAPPPVSAYAPPPVIVQPAPVYVAPPPPPQYWYLCLPLIGPIGSRRLPQVFVMKPTDAWHCHHPALARWLHTPRLGRALRQR